MLMVVSSLVTRGFAGGVAAGGLSTVIGGFAGAEFGFVAAGFGFASPLVPEDDVVGFGLVTIG
jgi:hypothetical protein